MTVGAYLISSVSATKDDYLLLLADVGMALQMPRLASGQVFDGDSNLWIRLIDAEEPCYEEGELKEIEALLEAPPMTFISLEFNGGEMAGAMAMRILRAISERWPVVYDDCYRRFYAPSQIVSLCENGEPADIAVPACPASIGEAIEKAWSLVSQSEKDMMRRVSMDEARLALYFSLGHRLRAELALWGDDVERLFDDMNTQLIAYLAAGADTASAALIDVLWAEARRRP